MAKKIITQQAAASHVPTGNVTVAAADMKPAMHALVMAVIAALVWVVLKGCLGNQFTNWDDPGYIQDNTLIKDLSAFGLKGIFSKPVMGNYHPLTILSYAIEYSITGLEPWLYYFDNLVLHIIDTLLVYWLVVLLTKRPVAAVVTALLFGLHPMHVESVAWVSGRKDVLYALFFIGSCICHVYYLRAAKGKRMLWYAGVLVLFICSILAKPVAVTLPLTLLLIDYLEKREWKMAVLLEKIPHFLIALAFGIIAVKAQHSAGAMDMQKVPFNFIERIALGCYAFVTYLWKLIAPVQLSNAYSYPQKVNGALPWVYYLYPAGVIALAVAAWKYGRKHRVIVFGVLWFIVNIALLLQFIQVGSSIVADRYSYMPYLGLFFIAGWYISSAAMETRKSYRYIVGGFVGYMICLFFMSNDRVTKWHDTISLWTDAIEKDPDNMGGYNNLGYIYYQKWMMTRDTYEKQTYYDSASYFLNKAIELHPEFINPYISLGEMQRGSGRYAEARNNYFTALKYDKKHPNLFLGLAILYYITKDMDSAALWFRGAIAADPSPQAYGNYANFLQLTGKTDSALLQYGIAIERAPEQYASYLNRARVYRELDRIDESLSDLEKALKLNPDLGELYYERSLSWNKKGNREQARKDVEKAIALGYNKVDDRYYEGLK